MTICGLFIGAPDFALAWADTRLTNAREGRERVAKLVPNIAAHVVATGSGPDPLLSAADAAVLHASSLDTLVDVLPTLLRRQGAAFTSMRGMAAHVAEAVYGVAGWSHRFGRLAAWRFRGAEWFEAETVREMSLPAAGGLASAAPACDADLIGFALQQIHELDSDPLPDVLTVAVIRPVTIELSARWELPTGRGIARPFRLSALRDRDLGVGATRAANADEAAARSVRAGDGQ